MWPGNDSSVCMRRAIHGAEQGTRAQPSRIYPHVFGNDAQHFGSSLTPLET